MSCIFSVLKYGVVFDTKWDPEAYKGLCILQVMNCVENVTCLSWCVSYDVAAYVAALGLVTFVYCRTLNSRTTACVSRACVCWVGSELTPTSLRISQVVVRPKGFLFFRNPTLR